MSATKPANPVRTLTVALIGNPNTGKSTLFNALAGMQARVGNYPGVTVEKKIGRMRWKGQAISLVDLPGTYSLSPRTRDEMVSVDVLLGRRGLAKPDAVVCIVDASNLERNLYLFSQILDLGLPTVLVLNMTDVAQSRGMTIDAPALARKLGIPVVKTQAHRKQGLKEVRRAIAEVIDSETPAPPKLFPPEFDVECDKLGEFFRNGFKTPLPSREGLGERRDVRTLPEIPSYLLERLILDVHGEVEAKFRAHSPDLPRVLHEARERLKQANCRVPAIEAKVRYAWIKELLTGVVTHPAVRPVTGSDRIDGILTHRMAGLAIFCVLMLIVFQAIYAWAGPFMDAIEGVQGAVASLVENAIAPGPLRSLLVDGVIAGVGGVITFLPQIVFLFFFIALLEDCGYMARAAFLMDRLMTRLGLSGKSFIPLMSSFACAIPGVMATRVIENRRDRMTTILIAPLMSCSARLPVYLLLIAAFIPPATYLGGWITLHALVLLGMSSVGALVAIPVAWVLKKTIFKGEIPPFVMELPSYKWPSPRIVANRVYDRAKAFVMRAGTLIFATSIVVWAAGYFPGDHSQLDRLTAQIESQETQADADKPSQDEIDELTAERNRQSSELISGSFLGRAGHAIEPLVKPLGWDWRIGVGAIASFPAREVIISTLGTIYSLGGDVDAKDESLQGSLRAAAWPDGQKVYNVPVALSIMVFFALCAQCAATLMVIKRETNSWRWPVFTFVYMTALAYVAALITYQVGIRIA
ncbi:MAG: ferrous iron transport protein B [Planctomycetaceae bacterium]